MATSRKPLRRSLIIGCTAFTLVLCVLLSVLMVNVFSRWFYERYNAEIAHVLATVESTIDIDDMQASMESGVKSAKLNDLQAMLNDYVDYFEMAYIYILIPQSDGTATSICSSTSDAERAEGAEDLPFLYTSQPYTPESVAPYIAAWNSPEIVYFEDDSEEWGNCYTGCKPLVSSDGETLALLCGDYFIDNLHEALGGYLAIIIALTVAASAGFCILLVLWLRRNVTDPIQALEHSAHSFTENRPDTRDLNALVFNAPDIRTYNELKSLSDALVSMSESMRDYVQDIVSAEQRALSAEEEAEGMARIAYEDALTHVKSAAAYTVAVKQLEEEMESGEIEFAAVMVDLDNLKGINDAYGHEHGDEFITGSCAIVCEVFSHSPVFRIGGDEFVALLRGRDYENRAELMQLLHERFAATRDDDTRDPWKRYSASAGMADYDPSRDRGYTAVFRRADEAMYQRKASKR